ncbi:complexed with cef1p [Malassezia sp. CBS 17886]|nr:complexed with cef1p [Malassezia sp. CBS 17886]
MSSAHRPTWEAARGKGDTTHLSHAYSKYALPAQTHLKFRKPGDTQRRSLLELREQLEAGEKRARIARDPDAAEAADDAREAEEDAGARKRRLLASAASLDADDADAEGHAAEADGDAVEQGADEDEDEDEDEEEEEDEDEDEEDEEDDTETLLRELEKIKQERRDEKAQQEALQMEAEQLTHEEEVARGNPLLNLEQALHGAPRKSDAQMEKRWDEDLIFRNQAVGADNQLSKRGFVNDLTRTEFHKKFMSRYIK